MKPIKFRARLVITNELTYFGPQDIRGTEANGTLTLAGGYVVAIDSIQQFTGLLDKNGKEIYEDDLLRVKYTLNEGKEGQYVEGVHQVIIDPLRGLRLYYRNIYNPDEAKKNQYPISMDLCREHRTLDTDHRNNFNGRLAVMDSWGENHMFGNTWKKNDYSNDIEKVGNIYENPELLTTQP
jgi:uncharacterized phage protein (TIGR01671 family)